MTLLFSESFAGYTSSADFTLRGWTLTNSGFIAVNSTGSPWGDNCLEFTSRSTGGLPSMSKNFHATAGSGTTARMAFWIKTDAGFVPSDFESASGHVVSVENSGSTNWIDATISNEGYLMFSITESARSSTKNYAVLSRTPINDGNWHHVEYELVISTTVGTAKLWVDGELQHSVTGRDTSDAGTNMNNFTKVTLSANRLNDTAQKVYLKDILVWDDLGTDFTGALTNRIHRIATLFPDGAGNSAQFTPSTGSNYQNVDEASPDSDTTYNESSTAGHIDSFTFTNMPWSTDAIYSVVSSLIARSTAGTPTLRSKGRISSTDYNGTTHTLSTSYTAYEHVWDDSPASTNDWTDSEINGAEFGYEGVSGGNPVRVTRQLVEVVADEASTDEARVTSFFIEVVLKQGTPPASSSSTMSSVVVTS